MKEEKTAEQQRGALPQGIWNMGVTRQAPAIGYSQARRAFSGLIPRRHTVASPSLVVLALTSMPRSEGVFIIALRASYVQDAHPLSANPINRSMTVVLLVAAALSKPRNVSGCL
jgi:hypothetical protein